MSKLQWPRPWGAGVGTSHVRYAQESCRKQAPETLQQFVCLSVCFKQRSHTINWEEKVCNK